MSREKKRVRADFRARVFARDGGRCCVCKAVAADAHHIIDRHDITGGGYTLDNGISLCSACHLRAEEPGFKNEIIKACIRAGIPVVFGAKEER